ncbi:hypothetical protein L2E82_21330 [Cichorium intybus]|uniref:Uncharacterized protein n=1 Tax=Cichorium intybus TaxID=13427 RepID=A0ACB9DWL6_CICIN|nr:hypothetical protein L2E82_21330 [Cichorium intybus]
MDDWFGSALTLVGDVKSVEHLRSLQPEKWIDDETVVEVKYLGGLRIAMRFRDSSDLLNFRHNWGDWFDTLGDGRQAPLLCKRVVCIKIVGVPVNSWSKENFNRIASKFGRVLIPFETLCEARDLAFGKVCILSGSRMKINEEVAIAIGDRVSMVVVFESDEVWSPFGVRPRSETGNFGESSDDEDGDNEDGISDTIDVNSVDLEDGEIPGGDMDVEVVEESSCFPNDGLDRVMTPVLAAEPGGNSGDTEGNNDLPRENERLHGEPQQSQVNNLGGDDYSFEPNVNSADIPRVGPSAEFEARDHCNFDQIRDGFPEGCFGPFPFNPNLGAPSEPIVGGVESGKQNLAQEGGLEFSGSFIKRRRNRINRNLSNITSSSPSFSFDLPPVIESRIPVQPSSSSIDLNRDPLRIPHSPEGALPLSEVELTAEIGQMLGFEVNKDDAVLVEAVGQSGEHNGLS